jgi:ABC-type multidrug transport system permease subunit
MKRFIAVFKARNLEFFRDKAALGWNIVLPIVLILAVMFLVTGKDRDLYKVGVKPAAADLKHHELTFFKTKHIKFIIVEDLDQAIDKVKHHQLDMVIDLNPPARYWVNSTSAKGYFLEKLLVASSIQSDNLAALARIFEIVDVPEKQTVEGEELRYVDWVLPGVLAVNMMFSCLYGIGYIIVRYRKNQVLRRLKATPLTAFEFLAAQVVSRLWIIMAITVVVYIGCDYFVDFYMRGSVFDLFIVFLLGAVTLISMGLIIASRLKSEELSDGILNMISWPMMLLSGVWFSLEGAHPYAQKLSQVFPLTHVIDAARAIMIDGAGLVDVSRQIIVLVVMSVVFLVIGSVLFRWE